MKRFAMGVSAALTATMMLSTAAMAGDTFKIGSIGPVTGPAAAYGSCVMNAAQIAIDEINEAGGINGYQVEFNAQDDELDAEKALRAYDTLKDWDMQILLGTVTSASCIAVEDVAADDNMFLLTPSGSAVDCITKADNAYRICFSDPAQGTASAVYIGENALAEKVGIIYDSSDVYSTGICNSFRTEAENQPFEIVGEPQAFTADSKTDFTAQLQALKDAGAELVFLPFYYNEISIVLTQAASMDFAPQWFGVDGMDGLLGVENFDTSLAEGCMLLTPFAADAQDEMTQNFVSKYTEAYGDTPNQFGADAYDGIYVIKTALEAAGATPDMNASDLCDALKAQMTQISYDGLTGSMTWSADGEPTKSPKAVQIQDGAYVSME